MASRRDSSFAGSLPSLCPSEAPQAKHAAHTIRGGQSLYVGSSHEQMASMSPRDSRDPASQRRRGEEAKRKEESSSCSSSINRIRTKSGKRPDKTREREKRHVMLCNPRGTVNPFAPLPLVGVDPRQRASRRDTARLVERHGSLSLLHRGI